MPAIRTLMNVTVDSSLYKLLCRYHSLFKDDKCHDNDENQPMRVKSIRLERILKIEYRCAFEIFKMTNISDA